MADEFNPLSTLLQSSPIAKTTKQVLGGISGAIKSIPPQVIENMKKLAPIPAPVRYPGVPAIHNTSDAVIKAPTLDFSKAGEAPAKEDTWKEAREYGATFGQVAPESLSTAETRGAERAGLSAAQPIVDLAEQVVGGGIKATQMAYQLPVAIVEAINKLDLSAGLQKLIPEGTSFKNPITGETTVSTFEQSDRNKADAAMFAGTELAKMGIDLIGGVKNAYNAFKGQTDSAKTAFNILGVKPKEIDGAGTNINQVLAEKIKQLGETRTPLQTEAYQYLKDNPISARIANAINRHSIDPEIIYKGFVQDLTIPALPAAKANTYRKTVDKINSFLDNPLQTIREMPAGLSIKDITHKGKVTMLKPEEGGISAIPSVTDLGVSIPAAIPATPTSPLLAEAKKYSTPEEFVKAQPAIYHGTPAKFEKFDTSKSEGGATWFTEDSSEILSGEAGAVQGPGQKLNIMERRIKPGVKLATPDVEEKLMTDQMIAEGYRGVTYPAPQYGDKTWTKLWFPNEDTFTTSDLTSIWNQAHGKGGIEVLAEVKNPVRFEIGKKLTEPEKQEVLKSLSDSYKTKRRPYTVEDIDGIEKRVYTEDAGEYMVTSDITGKKLRHYVTLPDGKIAHPTEIYGNITKGEIDSMANELDIKDAEYNSLVKYLDSVGEKKNAIIAINKAIENGAKITDTGIRFPGQSFSITIPEYIRNTTGSFAGLQNIEEIGVKEHNILNNADWKRLLEESTVIGGKTPTSLPTATSGIPIQPGDISKAAEEKVLIKPEQPTDLSYLTTKKDFKGHLKTFVSRLVDSEAIKKIGKSGEQIFNKIKLAEHTAVKEGSDAMFKLKSKLEVLSKEDTANFVDYVEGKKPTPPSAQPAVDEWKNIAKDIADKSQEYGIMIKTPGGKVPFKPKADYVPYYVDENKLDLALRSAVKRNDLLQEMAAKGKITVAKASEILDDMVNGKESMFGHLEKARMANLPDSYYKREPVYLFDYIKNAYDRLSMAKEFGGDDAGLQALIEEARKSGADYQELQALTERALGRETFDRTITNISRGARAYNNITKLSLAALTNIGDIVKPFVRTNFLSTIKGIRQSFTKTGTELAEKAGVTGKYIKDMLDVVGDTTIDSKMFKITGFNLTENKLRQIAVNAAKNYVDLLVKKLKANPNNVFALRRLEQFGLDGKELLKNGVKESDYIDAGIQAVADAQPTSKLDIPYYWQSPVGKMATQYKTFSYKQARFFGKFIKDEFKKGNPKPLIMFLLVGTAVGEGVADLKAAARGRTRIGWNDPVRRIIDDLMTVGGVGLATDFLANMQYGTLGGGFLKFVVGPTLSDIDDTISRTVSDIQNVRAGKDIVFGRPPDTGETQIKMLKKAIYSVPVLGPIVSNLLFPTRGNYQSKTIPIAEDILQLMSESDKTTKADEIRKRLKQANKKNVADEIRKKLKQ